MQKLLICSWLAGLLLRLLSYRIQLKICRLGASHIEIASVDWANILRW